MSTRVLEMRLRDIDAADKAIHRAMQIVGSSAYFELQKALVFIENARRSCIQDEENKQRVEREKESESEK